MQSLMADFVQFPSGIISFCEGRLGTVMPSVNFEVSVTCLYLQRS